MPRRSSRPHVSVNMAMSLDGKISTARREQISLGSKHDRRLMDELRCEADAVVIGAGTVRHDGYPIIVRYADLKKRRTRRGAPPHPVNVVVSSRLDFPTTRPIFRRRDTQKILFATRQAPASRIKLFERSSEVVVLRGKSPSPMAVLDSLHDRNLDRVLLEGGGELHYAFLAAGLVDEVFITLTPRLLGGASAPTVLDGRGFPAAHHPLLHLVSCRKIGDELFLRYRLRGAP